MTKVAFPYVSYRTFRNFLELLKEGLPSRIDRSVWGPRYSGTTQGFQHGYDMDSPDTNKHYTSTYVSKSH